MTIPKDWPPDKPLPNPYRAFPFIVCKMLTPNARQRQKAKEDRAYYQKAFGHLRPKPPRKE